MGTALHQLCPRYSGTLTPTAPTTISLWETFTFFLNVGSFLRASSSQGSLLQEIIKVTSYSNKWWETLIRSCENTCETWESRFPDLSFLTYDAYASSVSPVSS